MTRNNEQIVDIHESLTKVFLDHPELFPLTTYFLGSVEGKTITKWLNSVDVEVFDEISKSFFSINGEPCSLFNFSIYDIDIDEVREHRDIILLSIEMTLHMNSGKPFTHEQHKNVLGKMSCAIKRRLNKSISVLFEESRENNA